MRKFLAAAAVAALILSGCSSSKTTTEETPSPGESAAASARVAAFEVSETAPDKATFTGPSSTEAGLVEIQLKNSGQKLHAAQLATVDAPHTQEEMLKIVSSESDPVPPWLHGFGGPVAKAGETVSATVNLSPGSYYVFDYEPVDQEAENSPNFASTGTITKLEVTGTAKDVALPKADMTVSAKEYSFSATDLASGPHTVEWKNTGQQHHLLVAFPFAEGATLDQVKAAFTSETEPQGPPPVDFENAQELTVLGPGVAEVTTVNFKPGKYAFVCFLTDEKNPEKPPHFVEGMLQEFDVK